MERPKPLHRDVSGFSAAGRYAMPVLAMLLGVVAWDAPRAIKSEHASIRGTGHAARVPIAAHTGARPSSTGKALRYESVGDNWSGYAQTGGPYTSAQGTWVVPPVSPINYSADPFGRPILQSVSAWVGIGGDPDVILIQLGTGSQIVNNVTGYNAWYELYPADPIYIDASRFSVNPGDTITASLQCMANCVAKATSTWVMSMASNRWKTPFTIQVSNFPTSLNSVEWIVEDNCMYCSYATPSAANSAYLPNYGSIPFSALSVNGANPNLSRARDAILATDPEGKNWSMPSDPMNGNSFTVTFVQPPH